MAEQDDVVLQRDIGAPPSTAAAATASATAESAATAAAASGKSGTTTTATTRKGRTTAATAATKTHLAARRGYIRRASGRYATQCAVASPTAASTGRAAGPTRWHRTVSATAIAAGLCTITPGLDTISPT